MCPLHSASTSKNASFNVCGKIFVADIFLIDLATLFLSLSQVVVAKVLAGSPPILNEMLSYCRRYGEHFQASDVEGKHKKALLHAETIEWTPATISFNKYLMSLVTVVNLGSSIRARSFIFLLLERSSFFSGVQICEVISGIFLIVCIMAIRARSQASSVEYQDLADSG